MEFSGDRLMSPHKRSWVSEMPMITISAVAEADVAEVSDFEFRNRNFFERWINSRPKDFYAAGGVAVSIHAALRDAENDRAYQYLVREAGVLVARVNLTQIKRQHFCSASLGYRVGEDCTGRGIAKEAVRLAMRRAFTELSLWRVEATCRPENPASIKVLSGNGFSQFGHSKRCFKLGDVWFDLLHFETHAET